MKYLKRLHVTHLRRKADALLDADRPAEAWSYYSKMPSDGMHVADWWMRGVCCLVGLGKYQDAIEQFEQANLVRGFPVSRHRLLNGIWIAAIGHIAQLDYVIKMNILEGGTPDNLILWLPNPRSTANMFLLAQYLPYMKVVYDDIDLPVDKDARASIEFDLLAPRSRDGKTHFWWTLAADTEREWERRQHGPLIKFPESMIADGKRRMERVGLPQDAWFVTLHVREQSRIQTHRKLHGLRNAALEDYDQAIAEITDRGGWVVRIGDETMSRMPRRKNVIDYPHQSFKIDWLDVYLLSQNKFHIGSSSGVSQVPGCFGVPTLFANWWPLGIRPLHTRDLYLPKSIDDLGLHEILQEPYAWAFSPTLLKRNTVANTRPDDIAAATVEMLDNIERDTLNTSNAQRIADLICNQNKCHGSGYLPRSFLERRPEFLGDLAMREAG